MNLQDSIHTESCSGLVEKYPQETFLTIMNFATKTMVRKKNVITVLSRIVRENASELEIKQAEYTCFSTAMPTTVALPAKYRVASIELTALLYLLLKQKEMLNKSKKNQLRKALSDYFEPGNNIMQIIADNDFDFEAIIKAFWNQSDIVVISAILCWLEIVEPVYRDGVEDAEQIFAALVEYDLSNQSSASLQEKYLEVSAGLRSLEPLVGRYKTVQDYQENWLFEQMNSRDKQEVIFDPFNMIKLCLARAGVDSSVSAGDSSMVSKLTSEAALMSALESIMMKTSSEDWQTKFRKNILQVTEKRKTVVHNYLSLIPVIKVMQQFSVDILQNVKAEMFGDKAAQKCMEKSFKEQEELRLLKQENELLNRRIRELEEQKLSARKREDVLKAQIAALCNVEKQDAVQSEKQSAENDEEERERWSAEKALAPISGFEELFEEPTVEYHSMAEILCEKHKVIIIGGNENLIKRLRGTLPQITYLNDERIGNCDMAVQNAELLLFKVDSMPHSIYQKCKAIARACKIPYDYIPETTSVSLIEKVICDAISKKLEKGEMHNV